MSNNLNLSQLSAGQANPEVTSNDKGGEIDAALTETINIDVTSGNVTVTAAQYTRAIRFSVINASVARVVTLQAIKRLVFIESSSANTANVTITLGTTSIVLSPGQNGAFYTDGTANGLKQMGSIGGAISVDLAVFVPGLPGAGVDVLRYVVVRQSITFPVSLTGSSAKSRVAATASATFNINKNGANVGTIVFAAASATATFTFAASVTFAVGDVLEIVAPGTQDTTLADVSINLTGTRP